MRLGFSRWPIAAIMSLAVSNGAALAACNPPQPVRFAAGALSADVAGGLPRGERDCFTVTAKAGQRLAVTQREAADSNIVLQIYRPVWKTAVTPDGMQVNGAALKGAEEGADAAKWTGTLPVSGTYLLVLGTSRGSGDYHVHIAIQ